MKLFELYGLTRINGEGFRERWRDLGRKTKEDRRVVAETESEFRFRKENRVSEGRAIPRTRRVALELLETVA